MLPAGLILSFSRIEKSQTQLLQSDQNWFPKWRSRFQPWKGHLWVQTRSLWRTWSISVKGVLATPKENQFSLSSWFIYVHISSGKTGWIWWSSHWTPVLEIPQDTRIANFLIGDIYVGVSKNRGGPQKWMVYFMENPIKWMIWGETPLFLETPMYRYMCVYTVVCCWYLNILCAKKHLISLHIQSSTTNMYVCTYIYISYIVEIEYDVKLIAKMFLLYWWQTKPNQKTFITKNKKKKHLLHKETKKHVQYSLHTIDGSEIR